MRQVFVGLLVYLYSVHGLANPAESPVAVYKALDDFETTKEDIEMAITDRGMLVSGTLHIADMLNRTAQDLGYAKKIYGQADSIEFCSAVVSHKMVNADPSNLVICPFTIAVYTLIDEPKQVYVAFRRPMLAGEATDVTRAVLEMLEGIVAETVE